MKLNLGCGKKPIEGYTGVDLAPWADIVCDIRKLEFAEDNSVEEIISIHVIEHFYKWEIRPLLFEWRRVLAPGGKLIIETPDLLETCQYILSDPQQEYYWHVMYGNQLKENVLQAHKWMFTKAALQHELMLTGFKNIQDGPVKYKLVTPSGMHMEAMK